jgi:AcrR family transcriptional regulator
MAAKKTTTRRATYHHGDLKNALIEAALTLIGESGAESFTLREAARRLGVNHRAVYRHFADKATLLAALAEQGFAALTESGQKELARWPEDQVEERLLGMARVYVKFAIARPGHFRVMFGRRLNEDGRFPALEAEVTRAFRLLEAEVQRALALRVFKEQDVRDATLTLWSSMHGFASLVMMRRIAVKRERLSEFTARIFGPVLRGLA